MAIKFLHLPIFMKGVLSHSSFVNDLLHIVKIYKFIENYLKIYKFIENYLKMAKKINNSKQWT